MNLFKKSIKKLPYKDAFIERLPSSTISGGMLNEGNIYLMDYAIKNMPVNGHVLEIGCWAGLSANVSHHLMKIYHRTELFLGCDPWIYEGFNDYKKTKVTIIDGDETIERVDFMNYIKNAYMNSVTLFNKNKLPHTFQLTSDAFFEHYSKNDEIIDVFKRPFKLGGQISFCYIDGDHSYEIAKRDFENTAKYLKINGYILLDDSWDGSNYGSSKLIDDIKQDSSFRIVDKNPNYLIQKIK
ncbi:MAG: class I SAM-dependent methyltransferase [Bacteroidota bacterium]